MVLTIDILMERILYGVLEKAVKDALSDDTPLEENVAWVKEFSKDMQTPRGMPLWTSTPEKHGQGR